MNWLEPKSRTQLNMVRHYHRILKMDDSRLTKKILKYDLVFGQNGARDCWSTEVKFILNRNNLGSTFSIFPFNIKSTIELLSQSLIYKDQSKWKNVCKDMPKLRTYVKLDDFFSSKQFIHKPLTFIQRKFLAKLRLGVLPIRIETGRYHPRLEEADRICLVCNEPNAIENETHFLLKCSAYGRQRRDLLSRIPELDANFVNWSDEDQLKLLTCNALAVKSTAQFLIDAFDFRSTKI